MVNNLTLSTIQEVLQYLDEGELLQGTWKDVSECVKHFDYPQQIVDVINYLDEIIKPDCPFDNVCEMFGNVQKQPLEKDLSEKSIIHMQINPLDYINEYAAQQMFEAIQEELETQYPNTEIENFRYEFTSSPNIKITNIECCPKEEINKSL